MTSFVSVLFVIIFAPHAALAAVLHFYSNPSVPQPIFHVILEYKAFAYEADTRQGGRYLPMRDLKKTGDLQIKIADDLVDERALATQIGLPFDFSFIWNNEKTYCSKLVGIALNIPPHPMSFAGTHYLEYYPHWINRNDLGLSPDDIYDFAMKHALKVIRKEDFRAP